VNGIEIEEPPKEIIISKEDEELLKILEESKPKIYVVGTGGSGCNTLNRMSEIGIEGVKFIAVNTDVQHLLRIKADKKTLIGKKLTKGAGAGSNPEIGEQAAKESIDDLKNSIIDSNMVFITCGMGGGTGTGSAPIIAEIAKSLGALTVAVVTLPFTSEGRVRMQNALMGIDKLRKSVDTLIIIPNDKLLTIAPDLPLNTAFKVSDEVLASSVKGIAELITKPGMVNLDFADLRTILKDAGHAVIGVGEASIDTKPEERALLAIETALTSPLLDADITTADRALINVIGGEDMSLKEAELMVNETAKRINPTSHIIWGARVEKNLKRYALKVLVVIAGAKIPKYEIKDIVSKPSDLDLDLDILA